MKIIKMLAVLVFLAVAFPLALQAAQVSPSIVSFGVDRTTVQPGQAVTFDIRTTAAATFVFADANGVRIQATRQGADPAGNQNWRLSITPNETQTINIFASTTNTIAGAATMSIPVTVTDGAVTPPGTGAVGPLAIQSIRELPSVAAGVARLEVITGPEVGAVWVHLAALGNAGFFNSQHPVSITPASRTFIIEIRPGVAWHPQTVTVSANRTFALGGETTQQFHLTLAAAFVGNPSILNTVPAASAPTINGVASFIVNTNAAVNHVWAIVGGQRFEGRRGAVANQWIVDIWPPAGTGNITTQIWANTTNVQPGAVSVTRTITRPAGAGQFIGQPTFQWMGGLENVATIIVETGIATTRVSLQMPGTNVQHPFVNFETIVGAGIRRWSAVVNVPHTVTDIPIRAFTGTGTGWGATPHEERRLDVWRMGVHPPIGTGQISLAEIISRPTIVSLSALPTLTGIVDTTGTGVIRVEVVDPNFPHINIGTFAQLGNRWTGSINLNLIRGNLTALPGVGGSFFLEARAVGVNNVVIGTFNLGMFTLTH